jgi:hypothetical protein
MRLRSSVDIRHFGDMVRDLVARGKGTMEKVVREEARVILASAVRQSKGAKIAQIVKNQQDRQWRTYRGKRYNMRHRYSDLIWQQLLSLQKASIANKIKARGLTKQSWHQISEALGLLVKAPSYVINSRSKKGKPKTGTAHVLVGQAAYTLELVNIGVVAVVTHGRRMLNRILAGRVRQYRRAIDEEFRKDAVAAARGRGAVVR